MITFTRWNTARSPKVKLNLYKGSGSKDSTDKGDSQARLAAPVERGVEVVLAHLVVADRVKLVKEGIVSSPGCHRVEARRRLELQPAPLPVLQRSSR